MPPLMLKSGSRMTANPLKPVSRYRPGKPAVEEKSSSESESDVEEEEVKAQSVPRNKPQLNALPSTSKPLQHSSEDSSDEDEGFVTEDEDEKAPKGGQALQPSHTNVDRARIQLNPSEKGDKQREESASSDGQEDDEESEEESDEEESSEEESSSDDERQKKFLRPTFIRKGNRNANGVSASVPVNTSTGAGNQDIFDQEQARRKEMADLMIKDKLERDALARAAGKKSWEDDDEIVGEDAVDDRDGIDPEAELAAWKLRELKRLKRDREAIEAHEREIEEKERRKNLTQAERDAEDAEFLSKQKEQREEGRGKASFLQRYHHKGAFFQDDETAEILRKRDLMGNRYVDEVQNREALPEYMQIRDMSKLGKKGRTRYKDLRNEDTGRWGDYAKRDKRYGDNGTPDVPRDVDERFQPDRNTGGRSEPTGANASFVKERRKRSLSPDREQDKRRRVEAD